MLQEATPSNDAWDWPLLFYVGTVLLNMKPSYFWRCTPRKLALLCQQHVDINTTKKKNKNEQKYIDQVF